MYGCVLEEIHSLHICVQTLNNFALRYRVHDFYIMFTRRINQCYQPCQGKKLLFNMHPSSMRSLYHVFDLENHLADTNSCSEELRLINECIQLIAAIIYILCSSSTILLTTMLILTVCRHFYLLVLLRKKWFLHLWLQMQFSVQRVFISIGDSMWSNKSK